VFVCVNRGAREPYREVAKEIEEAMEATIEKINEQFSHDGELIATSMPELPIHNTAQILDKLLLLHRYVVFVWVEMGGGSWGRAFGGLGGGARMNPCFVPSNASTHPFRFPVPPHNNNQCTPRSLNETGQGLIADGLLTDTIRRLKCFGVTLLPLDIRQESTVHTETLDAITRYLGLGSYAQWDEETRMSWLNTELTAKRPLLQHVRAFVGACFFIVLYIWVHGHLTNDGVHCPLTALILSFVSFLHDSRYPPPPRSRCL
jgi:hypothetical protein